MRKAVIVFIYWVVGLACLGYGAFTCYEASTALQLSQKAKKWPEADAKIVKVWHEDHKYYTRLRSHLETVTRFYCQYQYSVDGKTYTSDQISPTKKDSFELADSKVGDVISVHYNPHNPAQAFASTAKFPFVSYALKVFFLFSFGSVVTGLALYKVDPWSDFPIISGALHDPQLTENLTKEDLKEVRKTVGSQIKQVGLIGIGFVVLITGFSMWKTDMRSKTWIPVQATVVKNTTKDPRYDGYVKCQFATDKGTDYRMLFLRSETLESFLKLHPIGSKVDIMYDPKMITKVELASTINVEKSNKEGSLVIAFCLVLFAVLYFADARLFSLGVENRLGARQF